MEGHNEHAGAWPSGPARSSGLGGRGPAAGKELPSQDTSTHIAVGSASVTAALLPQGLWAEGMGCGDTVTARGRTRSSPRACGTYQVLELSREAAVVGLFHVHDLGVCAQDVKLTGPQERKDRAGLTARPEWMRQRELCQRKPGKPPNRCTYPRSAATSPESLGKGRETAVIES